MTDDALREALTAWYGSVQVWRAIDLDRMQAAIDAYLAARGDAREPLQPGRDHLTISGTFQSDRYPSVPSGKVPLSIRDPLAQDLLWEYARRHREAGKHGDSQFPRDLADALRNAGFEPVAQSDAQAERERCIRLEKACEKLIEAGDDVSAANDYESGYAAGFYKASEIVRALLKEPS